MKIEIDDDEEKEEINTNSYNNNAFNFNNNSYLKNNNNLKEKNENNKNNNNNNNNNSLSEQMEKKLQYYMSQKDSRNLENFIINNLKSCFNYKNNSMNLLQYSIFLFNSESAKSIMKIFSLKIEKKNFLS